MINKTKKNRKTPPQNEKENGKIKLSAIRADQFTIIF
jgi:hypothetical protein